MSLEKNCAQVRVWDLDSGGCFLGSLEHSGEPIRCMTVWVCVDPELHANVPVVATGGSSGSVCLWNVFSGKMLHLLRDHDDAIQALCAAPMHPALSNNNTVPHFLLSGSQQGDLMIHVVSSCTDIVKCATFMDADAKAISSFCWLGPMSTVNHSPSWFFASGFHGGIRLWRLEEAAAADGTYSVTPLRSIPLPPPHKCVVCSMSFWEEHLTLAAALASGLVLIVRFLPFCGGMEEEGEGSTGDLEIASTSLLPAVGPDEFTQQPHHVVALHFSTTHPDAQLLVGSSDGTVKEFLLGPWLRGEQGRIPHRPTRMASILGGTQFWFVDQSSTVFSCSERQLFRFDTRHFRRLWTSPCSLLAQDVSLEGCLGLSHEHLTLLGQHDTPVPSFPTTTF